MKIKRNEEKDQTRFDDVPVSNTFVHLGGVYMKYECARLGRVSAINLLDGHTRDFPAQALVQLREFEAVEVPE